MEARIAPEWLALEKALGYRPAMVGTPEEVVKIHNAAITARAAQAPPPDPSVDRHDQTVEGVPVRIYTPERAEDSGPLPIGVFTHSGGFLVGDLDLEDATCTIIAKNIPCILISVDYSLAPKAKMPQQLHETLAVYRWAHANAPSIGADPTAFFAIGGSAGGSLSLLVTNELAKDPATRHWLKGCVALVPGVWHPQNINAEHAADFTSYSECEHGAPVIDGSSMTMFFDTVGMRVTSKEDIFVGLSTSLHLFPRTYIAVCDIDPLRDDGIVFEKLLRKAGVATKIDNYIGLPHYFWSFPNVPQSNKFFADLLDGVRFVLGK